MKQGRCKAENAGFLPQKIEEYRPYSMEAGQERSAPDRGKPGLTDGKVCVKI